MAVVSRIARLKITDATGLNAVDWHATAAVQDTPAGSSVVVTIDRVDTGTNTLLIPDSLTLNFYDDNGSLIKTVSLTPSSTNQSQTFYFTANGNSGGGNRAGTIEIAIRATKTTSGPTNTYDVESDGSPNTPPTGGSTTLDRGWIRGTTTSTQVLSNISLGGGKNSPFQATDSMFLRTTLGATLYVARSIGNKIGSVRTGSSASQTSGNYDSTFSGTSTLTGRVNNGFPASSSSYSTSVTIPNASLTGQPDFTVTNTADSATIDPRLTADHLLQIDNNTYGSPPFSDPNLASQRVFPQNGYIATNIRAARGTHMGNAITGGLNSIGFNIAFIAAATGQDFGGTGFSTATEGGEAGWQSTFLIWTAVVGGNWTKTVSITTSDLSGASYLLNNSIVYALVATDPAIRCVVRAAPNQHPGRHFSPGSDLQVRINLFDTKMLKLTASDASPGPAAVIKRINLAGYYEEYLDSDLTWKPMLVSGVEQAAYEWPAAAGDTFNPTTGDPNEYFIEFSGEDTVDFNNADFVVIGIAYKDGSPYSGMYTIEVVGTANPHDSNEFDAVGIFK